MDREVVFVKKWLVILSMLLLTGCGKEHFETIGDEFTPLPAEPQAVISLCELPQQTPVYSADGGVLQFCDGYTLFQQVLPSGDLQQTLKQITGYPSDQLQVFTRQQEGCQRYDFVWTCAGEGGDMVCRGSILDDGAYHYAITVMAQEDHSGELTAVWNEIFTSFRITPAPDGTDPEIPQ